MMRRTVFTLVLLIFTAAPQARPRASGLGPRSVGCGSQACPRLWAGLQPGPYPVGFRSWLLRAQASEFRHGAQHLVQVSVWYPAAPGSGTPMTYRDYLLLKPTENSYAEPTEESRAAAIAELTKSLTDFGVSQRTALAIVDSPLYARLNAQTPMGTVRHPMVYIAEGNGQTAADQAILSEFLASHGYIVVTSPSVMRITGPLAADAQLGARAEEQADDIDRAASATGDSPNAVNIPVSVLGYDIGAAAALLYAMHHPTNALVLIDGAFDSPSKIEALKAAPMFDASVKLPPILSIHGEGNHSAATGFVRSLHSSELVEQSIGVKHPLFTTTGFAAAAFPDVAKATGASATVKRDVTATAGKALQFLDRIWMPTRPPG